MLNFVKCFSIIFQGFLVHPIFFYINYAYGIKPENFCNFLKLMFFWSNSFCEFGLIKKCWNVFILIVLNFYLLILLLSSSWLPYFTGKSLYLSSSIVSIDSLVTSSIDERLSMLSSFINPLTEGYRPGTDLVYNNTVRLTFTPFYKPFSWNLPAYFPPPPNVILWQGSRARPQQHPLHGRLELEQPTSGWRM